MEKKQVKGMARRAAAAAAVLFGAMQSPLYAACAQTSLGIWDCPAGTTGADLLYRIQNVTSGETIRLGTGGFTLPGEAVVGGLNPSNATWVTIEGAGMEKTSVTFTAGTHGFNIQSSNVHIKNMTILRSHGNYASAGAGIVTTGPAQGAVFENLEVLKFKEGIYLGGQNWADKVVGCYLWGNQSGLGVGGEASNALVVERNQFYGNEQYGVYFSAENTPYVMNITNNQFFSNGRSAILLSTGRMVTIANNYFDGNEWMV